MQNSYVHSWLLKCNIFFHCFINPSLSGKKIEREKFRLCFLLLSFIHSFIHSFIVAIFHSLIHSIIHSFIFNHSIIHSLILNHSIIHSFILNHSIIHSFILNSFFISFYSCITTITVRRIRAICTPIKRLLNYMYKTFSLSWLELHARSDRRVMAPYTRMRSLFYRPFYRHLHIHW